MTWSLLKSLRRTKPGRRPVPRGARPRIEELEPRLLLAGNTIPWNGGNWFLTGVNLPVTYYNQQSPLGINSDFGPTTSTPAYYEAVSNAFKNFKDEGVHAVRWWIFEAEDQWEFNAQGMVKPLGQGFYDNLDKLLTIAAQNQIYVDLTLMDARVLDNGLAAGVGGHANLAIDPNVGQSFLDNALWPLLTHIATDPAAAGYRNFVLAYDVMNEPELGMSDYWGKSAADPNLAQMQNFIGKCVQCIHQYGGGALATVGSGTVLDAGLWSGQAADHSDRPDFYCAHYYPDASDNVRGQGLVPAGSLLDRDGKPLDRPVVVEEFPTEVLQNLNPEAPSGPNQMSYDVNDTAPPSDHWSARGLLEYIYKQGYAGALGWSVYNTEGWSDWNDFNPSLQAFNQAHAGVVGPQGTVQAPAAPGNLTATSGNAQVTLNWAAVPGAASYSIYRGTVSGGEDPVPVAAGVTQLSFTDGGLTNGTTYYYVVRAVNGAGQSAASAEVSATPTAPVLSATAAFADVNDWGTGFTGYITLTNTGNTPINGWTLEFDFTGNITAIWDAQIISHVGNHYVVQNVAWDSWIGAGQSINFGFNADWGVFQAAPSNYVLNGVAIPGV
jgi:hypothetical protein